MNILWGDIENCVFWFSSVSYAFVLTSIDDSQQNQLLLNVLSYYQVVANGNFLHSHFFYLYCLTLHYKIEFSLLIFLFKHRFMKSYLMQWIIPFWAFFFFEVQNFPDLANKGSTKLSPISFDIFQSFVKHFLFYGPIRFYRLTLYFSCPGISNFSNIWFFLVENST